MFRKNPTAPLLGVLALLLASAPAVADGYHADIYVDEHWYGCHGSSWQNDYSYADNESYVYGRERQQGASCSDVQRDAALYVRGDGEELAAAQLGDESFQSSGSSESERGYGSPYGRTYERYDSSGTSAQSSRGASARALGTSAGAGEQCFASRGSYGSEASRSDETSYSHRRSSSAGATDGCAQRVDVAGMGVGHEERCHEDSYSSTEQESSSYGGHRAWSSSGQSEGCLRQVGVLGYALVAHDGCSAWSYSQQDAQGGYSGESRTCATGAALFGPQNASAARRDSSHSSCDGANGCQSSAARELVITAGTVVVAVPLP